MDRFIDERSTRTTLGQYDIGGKGGFFGTVTIVSDRDVTEVFEELVKRSFTRRGIRQGPSPFILRGSIKKVSVGASPDSQTLMAETFLELTIVNSGTGARIWQKSFVGLASGIDPKTTLAHAFQDLAIAVDKDDSVLGLRQMFVAAGGRLPEVVVITPSAQAIAKNLPVSDVDELPVVRARQNKNAYAVVIGIEQYRQNLPKADYAVHDAQVVAEYLTKVMGYPEENVVTLLDDKASMSDLAKYFEKWLLNNVEKDGTVFVYYSGHGAPNPNTGDAYLVPFDGDPAFIDQTGYSLKRLYESLGKLPARDIVVALDSCFSGAGGRSVIARGARPLVMNLETPRNQSRNMAIISASSGDQISSTYDEKGHGLFTYFLLKGLKGEADASGKGQIDIGGLFNYVKPNVERVARKVYNNEQSPQLIAPDELMKERLIGR
ncbi:MAG: caspase family protein [Deltaproteobacteria bacterium]|nr:caspase family protein [Deltaproteobacteria bacterium]